MKSTAYWKSSTIHHGVRSAMGITNDDWVLCDFIYWDSTHPNYGIDGYSQKSIRALAGKLGLRKSTTADRLKVLIDKGLVEQTGKGQGIKRRTTPLWYGNAYMEDYSNSSLAKLRAIFYPTELSEIRTTPSEIRTTPSEIRTTTVRNPDNNRPKSGQHHNSNININSNNVISEESDDGQLKIDDAVLSYSFDDFWEDYGYKKGKSEAYSKWKKLKPAEIEEVYFDVLWFVDETIHPKDSGKKQKPMEKFKPIRMEARRYLFRKRFQDERTGKVPGQREPKKYKNSDGKTEPRKLHSKFAKLQEKYS